MLQAMPPHFRSQWRLGLYLRDEERLAKVGPPYLRFGRLAEEGAYNVLLKFYCWFAI